ncbi:putative RNA-directed DNA polymerase, eukaryota, reverse transcriptase zinc-binding domain protein [Tanacetum coccineum]
MSNLNDIDKKIDSSIASDEERQSRLQLIKERDDLHRLLSMDLLQKAKIQWDIEGMRTLNEFYKFYKSKFKSFDSSFDVSSNPGFASLCPEDVTLLQQKVALEEIRKAVWDCGCGKSPRPDGFSFLFLKTYWNLFKDDIVNFVNEFMESGTMPKATNSAFITLIPKIPNPLLIKDYRLISLIGMQYKIVAKLLANRLSTVLDKLVSPTQSAFISGCQILDGPLMVSEIIEWYRKRNKRLMIFKVDFEKAFDTVSWNYLDFVLSYMGFGDMWRSWIPACLQSSLTSILVNGSPTPEFSLERGLRQGDPLSLFLFILIIEGLHPSLKEDMRSKHIKRVTIGNPSLKINISKSNLLSIGVTEEDLHTMASVIGCQASSFPITYLGLPIDKSGLGIGSLKAFNFALIQKWRWRFTTNPNLLWVKLIKVIHGIEAGFNGKGYATTRVWSSIVGFTNYLHSHNLIPKDTLKCHPGNGAFICFWKDLWFGEEPLCTRYNRLFRLDVNEDCLLSERFNEGSWNWKWLRPITSSQMAHREGRFLFCSFHSNSYRPLYAPVNDFYNNIFLWRFNLDRLPHRLNLLKHGIEIGSILCPICNNNMESAEHIFFSFEMTAQIWHMIRVWCNIDLDTPSYSDCRQWLDNVTGSHIKKKCLFVIIVTVLIGPFGSIEATSLLTLVT